MDKITINYCSTHDIESVKRCFSYENIELNRVLSNDPNIDIIPFDGLLIPHLNEDNDRDDFLNSLNIHPNYEISKKNPNIPVLFFHEHEGLNPIEYKLFIYYVSKTLNIKPKKIILLDTNIIERKGFINIPLEIQIQQFETKIFDNKIIKNKKFTFLNNRSQKIRFQALDSVLKAYENNIDELRNENIISYKNFSEDKSPNDLSSFKEYIDFSKYYKYYNTYEFYKKIQIPWLVDNLESNDLKDMYTSQNFLYGGSYFSIILETQIYYYDLDFMQTNNDFICFSEKLISPFCSDNLPFIIHQKEYYKKFEDIGFNFSYLKSIFDIDYAKNTLKDNFKSINKFVYYLRNSDLNQIKKDYNSVKPILENNKKVLKNIQSRKINKNILGFIKKVKKEKYE